MDDDVKDDTFISCSVANVYSWLLLWYLIIYYQYKVLTPYSPVVTMCVTRFNIRDLNVAHKMCLYVLYACQNKLWLFY